MSTSQRPPEASAALTRMRRLVPYAAARLPRPAQLVRRVEFPLRAPTVPAGVEPPRKEPTSGAYYDTDWARKPAARAARFVLQEAVSRPLAQAIADPRSHGLDRLRGVEAPVIFAANHHSHLDTGVLLASLPLQFRRKAFVVAAADYFFTNRVASVASALALNAIPFERQKVTRRSANLAAELLDEGWNMVIFPEGGRSPDGWGQRFEGGAAYLAVRCGVPVVPVHLWGTGRILPKGAKRVRPGAVEVTFGHPMWPGENDDSRHFGPRIEGAVAALADEAGTDWWQARRRAHAGATPSLTGPEAGGWRRTWALGDREPRRRSRPRSERAWP